MREITKEELAMLEACQSANDWSEATKKIKEAREGSYPEDWWEKVKTSGMMDRILSRWGESGELKLTSHDSLSNMLLHLKGTE